MCTVQIYPVHMHVCASSFVCMFLQDRARGRVGSQEARHSQSKIQHNNKSHRPDWLVHPAVACNTPPGWPNPTICKPLLQASGFKRESLQHNVTKLEALKAIHINMCIYASRSQNLPAKWSKCIDRCRAKRQRMKESVIIWCWLWKRASKGEKTKRSKVKGQRWWNSG